MNTMQYEIYSSLLLKLFMASCSHADSSKVKKCENRNPDLSNFVWRNHCWPPCCQQCQCLQGLGQPAHVYPGQAHHFANTRSCHVCVYWRFCKHHTDSNDETLKIVYGTYKHKQSLGGGENGLHWQSKSLPPESGQPTALPLALLNLSWAWWTLPSRNSTSPMVLLP